MEKYWKATKDGDYMRDAHIYASIWASIPYQHHMYQGYGDFTLRDLP